MNKFNEFETVYIKTKDGFEKNSIHLKTKYEIIILVKSGIKKRCEKEI